MNNQEQDWKAVVEKFPEANFLQSPKYAKMNELIGDEVVFDDFGGAGHALMIVRDAKRGRYLEIPCGPLLNWSDKKAVRQAFSKIEKIARAKKCVFVRMRPQLIMNADNLRLLEDLGLKKSPMHLAAEHTVMIDLTKSEDTLLTEMRRQTRYEVRRAEKLGITVTRGNGEAIFREFHNEQLKTAKRQNFVPPTLKVLLAERAAFQDDAEIYVARTSEGEAIAYGLIIRGGEEADYYEAASTELNRKLPGAYALLWCAIKDLKKAGYKRFNLWGIAPAGQPHHRYAGVTTFKTGFSNNIVEFVPAHDLVISRIKYVRNLIVENIRKKKRHL